MPTNRQTVRTAVQAEEQAHKWRVMEKAMACLNTHLATLRISLILIAEAAVAAVSQAKMQIIRVDRAELMAVQPEKRELTDQTEVPAALLVEAMAAEEAARAIVENLLRSTGLPVAVAEILTTVGQQPTVTAELDTKVLSTSVFRSINEKEIANDIRS